MSRSAHTGQHACERGNADAGTPPAVAHYPITCDGGHTEPPAYGQTGLSMCRHALAGGHAVSGEAHGADGHRRTTLPLTAAVPRAGRLHPRALSAPASSAAQAACTACAQGQGPTYLWEPAIGSLVILPLHAAKLHPCCCMRQTATCATTGEAWAAACFAARIRAAFTVVAGFCFSKSPVQGAGWHGGVSGVRASLCGTSLERT